MDKDLKYSPWALRIKSWFDKGTFSFPIEDYKYAFCVTNESSKRIDKINCRLADTEASTAGT